MRGSDVAWRLLLHLERQPTDGWRLSSGKYGNEDETNDHRESFWGRDRELGERKRKFGGVKGGFAPSLSVSIVWPSLSFLFLNDLFLSVSLTPHVLFRIIKISIVYKC